MGNKILRQRLRGPALAAYYPRRVVTFREFQDEFGPELLIDNEEEDDRLEHLEGYVWLIFSSGLGTMLMVVTGSKLAERVD